MNNISIAVSFTSFLTLLTLDDVIGLDDCHLDHVIWMMKLLMSEVYRDPPLFQS